MKLLGYAYASSPTATKLRFKLGCWFVNVNNVLTGFDLRADAIEFVVNQSGEWSYYSMCVCDQQCQTLNCKVIGKPTELQK